MHGRFWGRGFPESWAGCPSTPIPFGSWGVCPVLSTCIRPSSVMLLLALHLCVFTMFGMLLFTGEKVPLSFLSPAWSPGG